MSYKDKEKQLKYQRQWMAKRRADYFEGKTCVVCGSKSELKLDHIDPAIKISHRLWSWSEKRRLTELAKCQVLCSTCHKQKTQRECLRGTSVSRSVLTEEIVLEARKLRQAGYTFKAISEQLNFKTDTIRYAVSRNGWKHI